MRLGDQPLVESFSGGLDAMGTLKTALFFLRLFGVRKIVLGFSTWSCSSSRWMNRMCISLKSGTCSSVEQDGPCSPARTVDEKYFSQARLMFASVESSSSVNATNSLAPILLNFCALPETSELRRCTAIHRVGELCQHFQHLLLTQFLYTFVFHLGLKLCPSSPDPTCWIIG